MCKKKYVYEKDVLFLSVNVEKNSLVKPRGLELSLWEDLKLHIKFFNRLRVTEIFLLLLQAILVICVFQNIWPFHLSCPFFLPKLFW